MSPFGFGSTELGQIPVPGEAEVDLPAGKVKVRYSEDKAGRSVADGSNSWSRHDPSLVVTITAGEQPLELVQGRGISESSGFKTIHVELGTIELDAPTRCVVRATVDDDRGGHHNPRIVLRG